jgi:hypothetical protein
MTVKKKMKKKKVMIKEAEMTPANTGAGGSENYLLSVQ